MRIVSGTFRTPAVSPVECGGMAGVKLAACVTKRKCLLAVRLIESRYGRWEGGAFKPPDRRRVRMISRSEKVLYVRRECRVSVDFFPHLGGFDSVRHRQGENIDQFLAGMADEMGAHDAVI